MFDIDSVLLFAINNKYTQPERQFIKDKISKGKRMIEILINCKQDLFDCIKMFPNDDICNVDAARLAAQRLFKKYRSTASNEQPSLGKNQVNNLMKATYQAINMPYKPDEEDVFSFMSVFDSNQDGRIQLKDIQELAVKYLCGEEALAGLKLNSKEKPEKQQHKKCQEEIKVESSNNIENQKIEVEKIHQEQKYKQLRIQTESTQPNVHRVYSPKVSYQSNLASFYSPKNRIPSKESAASTSLESGSFKTQNKSQKTSTIEELTKQGKTIFQKYSNHALGVTEDNASRVMAETYQLFGMKNFKPTAEDVCIWMKLCDKNKDGIVEWQDYKYFIQRTYERNRGST